MITLTGNEGRPFSACLGYGCDQKTNCLRYKIAVASTHFLWAAHKMCRVGFPYKVDGTNLLVKYDGPHRTY